MKTLFDHIVAPSVVCWLDNLLLNRGQAFYNVSENFQKTPSNIYDYSSYLASKPQFVYDLSIPGATVISGVYVDSVFTTGAKLDYNNGRALFSGVQNGVVSGNYSAKEINIYETREPEYNLLFEKQNFVNVKNTPNWTGRAIKDRIAPCIFVKTQGGDNDPACFGGVEKTTINVRLVVVTEDNFHFCGINSLLRDSERSFFPLLTEAQLPFDYYGALKTGFNYQTIQDNAATDSLLYISEVRFGPFSELVNSAISPKTIGSFIDLKIEKQRYPRG